MLFSALRSSLDDPSLASLVRARGLVLAVAVFAAFLPADRASGEVLVDADAWNEVDEGVEIRGLDVRFTETDQEVEIWEGGEAPTASVGKPKDITLSDEFRTVRLYGEDAVFEVRLRATGTAVGAQIEISVRMSRDGGRIGGQLEAEDEGILGAWIEVESARLIR